MKIKDQKKYSTEEFIELLPSLNQLINQFKLTDKIKEYDVNGTKFLIRLNKDIIEMSLAVDRPIFPTLAFRPINNEKADLLYYRIGIEFIRAVNWVTC